jgi:hypothetical protein
MPSRFVTIRLTESGTLASDQAVLVDRFSDVRAAVR